MNNQDETNKQLSADNKLLTSDQQLTPRLDTTLKDANETTFRELTVKNRVFLNHLVEGKKTLEAYRLSGYKGNEHAAYQLRSDLKDELVKALEAQGIDRAGLMLGVEQLMRLPVKDVEISVKTKIDLLKLLAKMLPEVNSSVKPTITKFVINTQINTQEPSNVIDGELA
jgi:hypothetical protein